MDDIDWDRFCDKGVYTSGKFDLDKPFVFNGHKYATDKAIVIRVKTDEPNSKWVYPVESLPDLGWDIDGNRKPFPPMDRTQRSCPTCDGCGFNDLKCEKCEGNGFTRSGGCPECQSQGNGPKTKPCYFCRGRKMVCFPEVYECDDFRLSGRYGEMILELPQPRYVKPAGKPSRKSERRFPVKFVFDGGEGIVMQRSKVS